MTDNCGAGSHKWMVSDAKVEEATGVKWRRDVWKCMVCGQIMPEGYDVNVALQKGGKD